MSRELKHLANRNLKHSHRDNELLESKKDDTAHARSENQSEPPTLLLSHPRIKLKINDVDWVELDVLEGIDETQVGEEVPLISDADKLADAYRFLDAQHIKLVNRSEEGQPR